MEITQLPRKFKATIGTKEQILKDPDPQMTINEVKEFYTMEYPELNNAEISDQKTENDELIIEFSSKFKQKG